MLLAAKITSLDPSVIMKTGLTPIVTKTVNPKPSMMKEAGLTPTVTEIP